MEFTWVEQFLNKRSGTYKKMSGYYHDNYMVEKEGKSFVVRVPILQNTVHRMIPEKVVLEFLEKENFPAPRLLYADPNSRYFVHSFINGEVLGNIYPKGHRIPDWVLVQLAKLVKELHNIDPSDLTPFCSSVAKSRDTRNFFQYVLKQTQDIYSTYYPGLKNLYDLLLFPANPFEVIEKGSKTLKKRDFTVCHCDIHRANLICDEKRKSVTLIDWEACLTGDPAYDLAVHVAKMGYEMDQEQVFLNEYLKDNKQFSSLTELRNQIRVYRKLEEITLAIIDTSRYLNDVQSGLITSDEEHVKYASKYFVKLKKAWSTWGVDSSEYDPERIMEIFDSYVKISAKERS